MSEPICYHDGQLLPAHAVRISPFDRGLTLGDGLFETIRVYGGRPFQLAAHLARLQAGAAVIGMTLPADLGAAAAAVLAANGWTAAVLRLTVTRGVAPPARGGLLLEPLPPPTVLITGRSLAGTPPYPDHFYTRGLGLVTAGPPRNEHSPLSRCKTLNYLDQILIRQAAARAGGDEALQSNTTGAVVGASVANLFVVQAGTLLTPDLASGCLPGITRALVLALAGTLGLPAQEVRLDRATVAASTEAFLTNTLLAVAPVASVDGIHLPASPGPLTRRIASAFQDLTGGSPGS
ncbi:MAG TPA: aminotransferase class IV [Chloroflexia bacterium]|nr:aminotransferase class IV [Chloroflexia bacterium]